jgi:ferrous iron transport protein A
MNRAAHPNTPTMPLTMAAPGQPVQIVSVAAGQRAARRLAEMGLIPGSEIEIMQNQGCGPLLLAIRDTRLAIERGIAHKLLVQQVGSQIPEHTYASEAPHSSCPSDHRPHHSHHSHRPHRSHRRRARRGATNA